MLRKLRHPNIILFMAAVAKPPNLCLVTELLSGSLFDLLHNSEVPLSWKLVRVAVEICCVGELESVQSLLLELKRLLFVFAAAANRTGHCARHELLAPAQPAHHSPRYAAQSIRLQSFVCVVIAQI